MWIPSNGPSTLSSRGRLRPVREAAFASFRGSSWDTMRNVTVAVWPARGTALELADLLVSACNAAGSANQGNPEELVRNYLDWVTTQVRMLRDRLSTRDLERFITTQRYWATVVNPAPVPATSAALVDEFVAQAAALDMAAAALRKAADAWALEGERFSSLALVDTSFWMGIAEPFGKLAWHDLLPSHDGGSGHLRENELRLIVPVLVLDELDGLAHRSETRGKAVGVARWLYGVFEGASEAPAVVAEKGDGTGPVTAQLLFDPPSHGRAPINDDELVARTVALSEFLGVPLCRAFAISCDTGLAARADHAGLVGVLRPHTPSSPNRQR